MSSRLEGRFLPVTGYACRIANSISHLHRLRLIRPRQRERGDNQNDNEDQRGDRADTT